MVMQCLPLLQMAYWITRYQIQHTLDVCTNRDKVRTDLARSTHLRQESVALLHCRLAAYAQAEIYWHFLSFFFDFAYKYILHTNIILNVRYP